jgi:hypothetical protein
MSKQIAGLIVMAVGVLLGVARPATALDSIRTDRQERRYHVLMTGAARIALVESLLGAMRRLSRPECQHLFDDFTDHTGRTLTITLEAIAQSPADVLVGLDFVNGDDTTRCRTDRAVVAFTKPGSRVIQVCGQRFVQFAGHTKGGEILLIHELLHTLGLGENPPTSSRITNAVMKRCG